jgi:Protein of unknown function (DUF3237)
MIGATMSTTPTPTVLPLGLDPLCRLDIRLAESHLHRTPLGTRVTVAVADGTCAGERLRGWLLAVGGDWATLGDDGIVRFDVRALLRTHDDALVEVRSTGRAVLDDHARSRYLAGELVRADEMYARSSPLFETGDDRYAWLNGIHTLAVMELAVDRVVYDIGIVP